MASDNKSQDRQDLYSQVSSDPKIAQIYEPVPAEQLERLLQYRADHRYRQAVIDDVAWRYVAVGDGPETVLLLTGALGTVESSWQTVAAFGQRPDLSHLRRIAPDYPAEIGTMAGLTDGIAHILSREGVDRAHVFGGSFGGYVAQAFAQRHPTRTARMVISVAGPPNEERGQAIAQALRWMRLLPMPVLRAILRRRLGGLVSGDYPELAITHAHVEEVVGHRLTKEGFLNGFRRATDFDLNYGTEPGEPERQPGEVLLLMAEEDPSTPQEVREAMVARYPQAEVHLFTGASHALAILRQDEYLSAIAAFLNRA